ncbi:hypothetical protein VQ045_15045 [Aurantimonas sp. E1-2-R+4]|uniref:hypothetical protein n=1 Tax=Aurantimonas sp. E1-2-R+4 TaxID=3113714 RepID=UPI002F948939
MTQHHQHTDVLARSGNLPLAAILLAGLAGQAIFEITALVLIPALLGMPLMPAALVTALSQSLLGFDVAMGAAWAVHLVADIVAFPLGYLALRRAIGLSWSAAGTLWGIVLWLLAQAVLAPLAGRPFMLGFVPYTWVSLGAHLAYTLVVAFANARLTRR